MKIVEPTASGAGDQKATELSTPRGPSSPLELILLALITGMAAILRIHSLAAKSFWFDEGVSVAIARLDWYNFARILWRREANMSLYYFLLHGWLLFGGSEFFVRSFSVLFAVASVPAIYLLGRQLFDSRVGLIAAALLAVNAYLVQYSQDARSYSLMVLLGLLSSLYFLKCLSEPSGRNRTAYILSSVLAVYAQFFSLLLVVAQWASLKMLAPGQTHLQTRTGKDCRWITLLVSPILIFVLTTGAGPLRWVQRPGWKDLWTFALLSTGNGGPLLLLASVAACLAALAPAWHTRRERQVPWEVWRYRYLLCWLLAPLLLTLALSLIKPLFVPRYFIFCLPALLLLVARGLSRLRSAPLQATALLFVLILSLRGSAGYYRRDLDIQRDDWRGATQYLLNHAQPGDALLFHAPMGRMPYEFYHSVQGSGSQAPAVLYPSHGEQITFLDFVEKPDDAALARLLPQHPRATLVLTYAETSSGMPDARSVELTTLLKNFYPTVERHDFPGIEILLFTNQSE